MSPSPASGDAAAPVEHGGLHAFASETAPALLEPATPAAPPARSRALVVSLAALALIEAGPAALWLQARLRPPVPGAAPPPVEAAAAPAPILPAAPCTSAAADTGAAPAPASETKAAAAPSESAARPAPTPPALVAGMMSVAAPVPMRVYVKGRLVGTTEADAIMLPVGTHDVELSNDAVGYRTRRTVTVQAGRTTAIRLDAPSGTLNVNAMPWAEVWMDNQRLGETPIGNFQTPIGQHEIVFRHPELGERRTTVLVTLKQPARVSMDLRKK
jgi:hypothetical protein